MHMGHSIFGPKYEDQTEMWRVSIQTPSVLI
jgi:hypothetical protein